MSAPAHPEACHTCRAYALQTLRLRLKVTGYSPSGTPIRRDLDVGVCSLPCLSEALYAIAVDVREWERS